MINRDMANFLVSNATPASVISPLSTYYTASPEKLKFVTTVAELFSRQAKIWIEVELLDETKMRVVKDSGMR